MKALVFFLIGLCSGWVWAHLTVATECKRMGSFYVGKTTYRCTAIERTKEQQ